MTHRYFPRTARYAAFTLVELLAVIAIIVLLAVVAIPAVTSISGERDLTNAANTVWSMADLARTEAISRSTPVRLVVATGPGAPALDSPPYRAIGLWAYDPNANPPGYSLQISKWVHLPNSVQISTETDPYTKYGVADGPGNPGVHITDTTTLINDTSSDTSMANMTISGQPASGVYFQFQPSGSVYIPSTLGFSTNLYIFVLKTSAAAKPVTPLKDWRLVQIGTLVGQSKVVSP